MIKDILTDSSKEGKFTYTKDKNINKIKQQQNNNNQAKTASLITGQLVLIKRLNIELIYISQIFKLCCLNIKVSVNPEYIDFNLSQTFWGDFQSLKSTQFSLFEHFIPFIATSLCGVCKRSIFPATLVVVVFVR